MPFGDPLVAGNILIREAIRSPDYVPGTSGWTINEDGTAEFTNVQVTVTGTAAGLQIVRSSDGVLVGSINEDGVISGSALTLANNDFSIAGVQLSTLLAEAKSPYIAYGRSTSISRTTSGEVGIFEVAFTAPETKQYVLEAQFGGYVEGSAGLVAVLIRDGGSSAPTISSTQVASCGQDSTGSYQGHNFWARSVVTLTAGLHRLLLTGKVYVGGVLHITGESIMTVSQFSEELPNLAVDNTGGGTPPPSVQTYRTQWAATWTRSYGADNAYNSFYGNEAHQGYYDGSEGNQKSLIGFDYAAIMSALSGATILGCYVTLYAFHWYNNSGGTAVIGTHDNSSAPSTFTGATSNRIQSTGWPKPGLRSVDLTTAIGNEFKSGATRGIVLGPGVTTGTVFYGKFDGAGMGFPPVITIDYQK